MNTKELILNLIFDDDYIPMTLKELEIYLKADKYTKNAVKEAVDHFGDTRHIRKIVQILNHVDSKHSFQIVGLISALSFVIARSDQADPFSPWYDSVDLC